MMSTGDDDSFSSDSEDEFLTMPKDGAGGGNVDREAFIRKKLLESFYGKSAVEDHESHKKTSSTAAANGRDNHVGEPLDDTDDEDDFGYDDKHDAKPTSKLPAPGSAEDLDSVHFNAPAHTERHVINDSVHTLLETQEQLSCQVRTLDSSMQTLVYENYSRFIDATDAIRSIGTTVQAHEAGLTRLGAAMQTIHDQSHAIENSLGTLRDTVVEKLRVKRLLTRLDTLLKLPRTLRDQIAVGKYRLATKSYLSAANILRKHSEGFESLKTIETDCHGILSTLLVDLKRKLIHWSGGMSIAYDTSETNDAVDDEYDDNENRPGLGEPKINGIVNEDQDPPDPPKTVAEIFECAGTPILLLSAASVGQSSDDGVHVSFPRNTTAAVGAEFHPGLTAAQCKDMALSASLRLLERVLDGHHIELQEAHFSTSNATGIGPSSSFDTPTDLEGSARSLTSTTTGPSSSRLIPTHVLDSILEAATLYSISLGNNDSNKEEDKRLTDFVSEAFSSFLTHVRGELLEQSALVMANASSNKKRITKLGGGPDGPTNANTEHDEETENKEEEAYEQISHAMMLLIQSVRQLASGLALPEVGVPLDLASLLVDQAIGLTEAMVRRRVEQKFYTLRFRVIKDCLQPLCRNAIEQHKELQSGGQGEGAKDPARVLQVVQMASVALSDSLQLVDDTVRSILSTVLESSSTSSPDASMLKQAVETSTKRFAMWLANAMEVLAGCESSSRKCTIEAKPGDRTEDGGNYDEINVDDVDGAPSGIVDASKLRDDVSEVSDDQNGQHQDVENALVELVDELESPELKVARSDMTLAIAEMCRVAERSVMENINQSIGTHGGGGKQRRAKSIFPDSGSDGQVGLQKKLESTSNPTAERFRLAASRILGLYAVTRGSTAGWVICRGLIEVAALEETDVMPEGPRPDILQMLELVKATSYDCAALFGGSKRAGPVPSNLEDQLMSGYYNSQHSSKAPGRSGFLLDVERMFAEQIVVYPHPGEYSDFTRNSVLALVLKVAFKALVESARRCKFTAAGYRQCMVDLEFLKFIMPHYITNDFLPEGSAARAVVLKLLSDAIDATGERCLDFDSTTDEGVFDLTNQARSVIREFMSTYAGPFGVVSKFVIPED
jgi:vacuolar protein sorting-associated protein 51